PPRALVGAGTERGRVALSARNLELLRSVSAEILEAQKPLRVLRAVAWSDETERAFFESGARELPKVEYRIGPEVTEAGERFRVLRTALAGPGPIETFLRETCDAFSTASRMLLAVGTKDFYYHSVELYGRP